MKCTENYCLNVCNMYILWLPIWETARCKSWVYGRSFPGIAGSNPTGSMDISFSCKCCVLSGRGLCDGLINRPKESYRVWCVLRVIVGSCREGLGLSSHENKNCSVISLKHYNSFSYKGQDQWSVKNTQEICGGVHQIVVHLLYGVRWQNWCNELEDVGETGLILSAIN